MSQPLLICLKCRAENKPGASPTIVVEKGVAHCSNCSNTFRYPSKGHGYK